MSLRSLIRAGSLAAALVTGAFAALPALAEDLVMSSWLPPRHPVVLNALKPWADDVEKATEGRVTIRILTKPLGSPPAHFDMARDGVADITYGLHSFTEDDRFKRARIGQFSFLGDDAVMNSVAFWRVYGGTLDAAKEHAGTHILALFMHGPGVLHTRNKQITALPDFQGLKIRVPGGYVADLVSSLGSAALFMSSPEVYEKLSRGVIDGVAFTYEAVTAFKLTSDIHYTMTVPGGIYNTTWFMVMNDAKWNKISPADQAKIMDLSGEAFARRVGTAWNNADAAAKDVMVKAGIVIYPAPADVLTAMGASATKLEDAWAASLGDYNGKAALAEFRAITGVKAP